MSHAKKVAIIEDEEELCAIYSALFTKAGYEAIVAHDGEEGLRCIQSAHPDLVILDLNLPKRSGEEICRKIKDNYDPTLSHIPILVVSSKIEDVDRVRVRALGADAYLTKPVSLENLLLQALRLA